MSVETTYFSALSHEQVTVSNDARVFGIVRRPADWITDVVDRNIPALAPPDELLEAYKSVEAAARDAEEANPQEIAWRSVRFEARFDSYLSKPGPRRILRQLVDDARERPIWLVCFEANEAYCHRRLVAARIRELARSEIPERPHLDDACPDGEHELVFDGRAPHTRSCLWCGLSAQTITDWLEGERP